jgi:hypothetical protein
MPRTADADGDPMRANQISVALVTALATLAVLPATSLAAADQPSAKAASASKRKAKPKPKPKPQIQASLTECMHTLGSGWPGFEGRESNALASSITATAGGKGLGNARATLTLTGPDVLGAGGTALTDDGHPMKSLLGRVDYAGSILPVFGADGLYKVSWLVQKKGYKPATGSQMVQAVAGREDWYGGFKGVPCEGWTSPAANA